MQQVGNKIQVYDDNLQPTQSKKITNDIVSKKKQNRRPLGDICNIIQSDNEKLEKNFEKPNQENNNEIKSKTSPILEQVSTVQSSPSSDESLQRALDLAKRENDIALKEKLYGVTEYVDYVYDYLRKLECKNLIGSKHLNGSEMTEKMRSILVDWIIDVHSHFRLGQETLELSIYILDRYTTPRKYIWKNNC